MTHRFPLTRTDGIDAGLYGPQDGFVDPYAAVMGFERKADSLSVEYVQDRVTAVHASNRLAQKS